MDLVEFIEIDNQELTSRLSRLTSDGSDTLSEVRMWCFDAASSEMAKEKVVYRRLDEMDNLPFDISAKLEVVREASDQFREILDELVAGDPQDDSWDEWVSTAKNVLRDKNQMETLLLNRLPDVFSERALGKLPTEFENARESHEEIGQFQYKSTPFQPSPRPNER